MSLSELAGQHPAAAHGSAVEVIGSGRGPNHRAECGDSRSAREPSPQSREALHRIAEVRKQQGMSLRTVGRHMSLDVRELRRQEDEASDLRLSELYRWQEALGVPVTDLLVESQATLSSPVMERARLIKVMKTVAAIQESAESASIRRLAQTLVSQLVEIMPELEGVSPWPAVGQRRSLEDYGRAAAHRLAGRFWRDL